MSIDVFFFALSLFTFFAFVSDEFSYFEGHLHTCSGSSALEGR
jgi:hypothetical protein